VILLNLASIGKRYMTSRAARRNATSLVHIALLKAVGADSVGSHATSSTERFFEDWAKTILRDKSELTTKQIDTADYGELYQFYLT
jgi:hypothetical protein